jgi:5'-methylthioadenosine phosphorylase
MTGEGADLNMHRAEIGILGGSGLYHMPGLTEVHQEQISTPFGEPSDWMTFGELRGRKVAFLARHGRGHHLLPSDINYRANIYAMKQAGVNAILSISAVGSLKEEHKPGKFVVPDQFIDRTYARRSTFFGPDIVAHVSLADPVCAEVGNAMMAGCASAGVEATRGGTYVCMEGPQFSTKAESNLYRSWGADVIGMTNLQEAKLAREAEICYGTVAMVTDYDCWHPGHDSVTTEQIVAVLTQNSAAALKVLDAAVAALPAKRSCHCQSALKDAILTQPAAVSAKTKQTLHLLLDKYFHE